MHTPIRTLGIAACAALISAAPLGAEAPSGWFLGAGLTLANDTLRMVTHKTWGLNLNLGLDRGVADTGIGFRPALGLSLLPGTWDGDSKTSLVNLQGTADLVIPARIRNLTLITGCSVNLWRYVGDGRNGQANAWGLEGSAAPGALKVGLRLGVDYRLDKKLSAEAVWQVVEFGNHPSRDPTWQNFNPSWVQVGVKVHY